MCAHSATHYYPILSTCSPSQPTPYPYSMPYLSFLLLPPLPLPPLLPSPPHVTPHLHLSLSFLFPIPIDVQWISQRMQQQQQRTRTPARTSTYIDTLFLFLFFPSFLLLPLFSLYFIPPFFLPLSIYLFISSCHSSHRCYYPTYFRQFLSVQAHSSTSFIFCDLIFNCSVHSII